MAAIQDLLQATSPRCDFLHLLVDLKFANHVLEGCSHQDEYATHKCTFFHTIVHDLSHGLIGQVGGLVHINRNHYIAFTADSHAQTIHFGNPQEKPIPPSVYTAFRWRLTQAPLGEGQLLDSDT